MKVSIGSKIVVGPWGGGNLFAINLSNYLLNNGHEVVYDLTAKDIDLILLTDPRSRSESSSTFNHKDIKQYKKYINPDVVIVQRINECDERKNTKNINQFYLNASKIADHVIFVSTWLRDIYLGIGMESEKTSVILAGANTNIFNNSESSIWDKKQKVKLVTHHWSSHHNKGFDIYKQLDLLIEDPVWKDRIEFTYIGNESPDYKLINTKMISPLAGLELASKIKEHHIYVTGSINEPSGNHHIEAAQCGLPILYRDSGGIPEYCNGFGVNFDENFIDKLAEIINDYEFHKNKISEYPFSAEKMCADFIELFKELVNNKSLTKSGMVTSQLSFLFISKNKIMLIFRKIFNFNIRFKALTLLRKFLKK